MLSKITKVKEVENSLLSNIVCCKTIDENGEDIYKYLTKSESFIQYLDFKNNDYYDDEDSVFGTYDLLKKESIEQLFFPGFLGEVFNVVSLQSPQYSKYLKCFNTDNYTVNYDEPVYYLNSFELVDRDSYQYFDEKGRRVKDVNGFQDETYSVSNFSASDFKETVGYLYLGEKSGVKFLSERTFSNIYDLDHEKIGLKEKEGDDSFVLKILLISLGDDIVDFIALDDSENSSSTSLEPTIVPNIDEFEGAEITLVDNESEYFDDVDDSDVDDWSEIDEIDNMDDEIIIDVMSEIKKNELDDIDDIDEDLDMGDD